MVDANALQNLPVLVTGANGFLGRALTAQLIAEGARVRAFVLPGEQVPESWRERVEVLRGDITDRSALSRAAEGCQKLFHLAAIVGDFGPDALHQRVTVGGTRNACEIAVAGGMQLLLASSIAVYGDRIGRETCTEDTPHGRAQGPYSRAKQQQERLTLEQISTRGLDAVIIRPANIYGAGCKPWLHDVGHELKRGLPVLMNGGDFDAGLVHVNNVADLFMSAARDRAASRKTLLAIDGFGITWKRYFTDLACLLHAPTPRSAPRAVLSALAGPLERAWSLLKLPGRPPITREALNLVGNPNRFDNRLTRDLLHWAPRTDYAHGMEEVARYIEEIGLAR